MRSHFGCLWQAQGQGAMILRSFPELHWLEA